MAYTRVSNLNEFKSFVKTCTAFIVPLSNSCNQDLVLEASLMVLLVARASVPQRLKNHSLYHEILLLQKFNDISGKVLKPKKQPPTSEKNEALF